MTSMLAQTETLLSGTYVALLLLELLALLMGELALLLCLRACLAGLQLLVRYMRSLVTQTNKHERLSALLARLLWLDAALYGACVALLLYNASWRRAGAAGALVCVAAAQLVRAVQKNSDPTADGSAC